MAGKSLIFPRTTALTSASKVTSCSTVAEQTPTISQAEFSFAEFITRYQLCSFDLDRNQYPNQLEAVLYAIAKRRLLYAYAVFLEDATEGLPGLCDPARVIDMAAGALTLDCLDEAYEMVTAGTGRPTLIMSNSSALRVYRKLCRDSGFQAERAPWTWYDPAKGRMVEGSVDAFNGTVWLANDLLGSGGANQIFLMVVGDDGGAGPTRGVTGIMPTGRSPFIKRVVEGLIATGPVMNPGTDTWVSMPAGLALGSQGALSIIQNFTLVAPCGG